MHKVLILNGPNLNLTGLRETDIYGKKTFEHFLCELESIFPNVEIIYKQNNIEGELIDILQNCDDDLCGIVFNPGAYAHTSVALADAIRAIACPVIEVHLSNVYSREDYRHTMLTAGAALACVCGLGMQGYVLAVRYLLELPKKA